ncbi:MAG TPA: ferritin family protein [Methanomassiliicoccales archaeon]|nr:ferritin family protein [Methanomassiliicoccales archaeon]
MQGGLPPPEKSDLSVAIIKTAIEIEKFGIDFYSSFAGCVAEQIGSALLKSLADDERKHKEILEKELSRLADTCDVSCVTPMQQYLSILPSKVFHAPPDACLMLADEIKAMELGIEVEQKSIEMYTDGKAKVKDAQTKATLATLEKWEETHRAILEENLRLLKLEGTWYGYSPILEG